MKRKRWIGQLAILDLCMFGLLLFFRFYEKVHEPEAIVDVLSTEQENVSGLEERKKIAITFDDGPHPSYTEQLLDGLKKRDVKASFFVTGEHALLHPEVIRRMAKEGHLLGNHTYSHIQLRSDNREKFKEELLMTSQILKEITGQEILYVRPPYGTWDKKLEQEVSMLPVLWTIDPQDWCSDDAVCIAGNILAKAGENDIILLHDYSKSSVEAALLVVDELQKQGYLFVTIDDLMLD